MRICVTQLEPVKGSIEKNLNKHLMFIEATVEMKPDLMMFPELSLTGYEPDLARELATTASDTRLLPLQEVSDKHNLILCVGLPTANEGKLHVSMIIFQPGKKPITYSKQYLYHTETGIFTPGNTPCIIPFDAKNVIAPAICFELSNSGHVEYACQNHATVYMASVLNSFNGVDADIEKLSKIASTYQMATFMANHTGISGGHKCAGKSSVWDSKGKLIAQLDSETEGVILYDTETGAIETFKSQV